MWTRSVKDGKFLVQVWNASNELTFTGEFSSAVAADLVGVTENRKALAPIMSAHEDDALLDMTDDELLAELTK